MQLFRLLIVCTALLRVSCSASLDPTNASFAAMVESSLNRSADQCEDFYEYACGGWLSTHKIPDTQPYASRFYEGGELGERNDAVSLEILSNSSVPVLHPFFSSCMDVKGVDAQGVESLAPFLDLIKGVKDMKSLMSAVGKLHAVGVPALFLPPRPADDLSNGTTNLLQIVEGGLALPDPSYYKNGTEHEAIIMKYKSHVAKMLQLLRGAPDQQADADAVVGFEAKLAGISKSQTGDYMKANASYHPLSVASLEKRSPSEWVTYFDAIGFDSTAHEVNPVNLAFFDQLPATVNGVDLSTLHSYLQWQLVHALSAGLPSAFASETWAFFEGVLEGAKSPPPREAVCLGLVNDGGLGWLLAKEWIARRFAGDSKDIATAMFVNIRNQFAVNAQGLDWLDNTTREYAVTKAKVLVHQIGYPDQWVDVLTDLPAMASNGSQCLANILAVNGHSYERVVAQAGRAVDPNDWDLITGYDSLVPQTVSAFNAESPNQLIIPAGIVQMPLFNRSFPPSLLYGGVAAVVGHEFTHSFDNVGRHFGMQGELHDWWTAATDKAFAERSQCFIDQYEQYDVEGIPGLRLNGSFVLQENIADNGGIRLSWRAYREAVGGDAGGGAASIVDGLTNDQLFFTQFAQNWCFKMTDDYARYWVENNQHSTPKNRARGCLSNMPEFASAFKCGNSTAWNPPTKCRIW